MNKIKDLKDKVNYVLYAMPITRNSDIALTIEVWRRYYPQYLKKREADGKLYVELDKLFDLPREDNIKRIRAKIQNEEHKYLPTVKEVAVKRGIEMDLWHKAMAFDHYPIITN